MPKTTFVRKPCTLDDVRTGARIIEARHDGEAMDSYGEKYTVSLN